MSDQRTNAQIEAIDYNEDDAPEATAVRLATIERCAMVARKFRTHVANSGGVAEEIEAAIRALGEKPPIDPNIIYPGKDLTNVFPEEGT